MEQRSVGNQELGPQHSIGGPKCAHGDPGTSEAMVAATCRPAAAADYVQNLAQPPTVPVMTTRTPIPITTWKVFPPRFCSKTLKAYIHAELKPSHLHPSSRAAGIAQAKPAHPCGSTLPCEHATARGHMSSPKTTVHSAGYPNSVLLAMLPNPLLLA